MESTADLDIEKGVAVEPIEIHASSDNSTDRDGKVDSPDSAIAEGKLSYWGLKMEAIWGVEARGITRVQDHEKNVPRPLHDYLHMFSLWFSINLQAVNIIIGLLGPIVYGLGWVDCVCLVIFANALASSGVAYLATFGPVSGNRTMACFPICHCFCKLIFLSTTDYRPLFHGLLAFENCMCCQYCSASGLWHHWMYHYWSDDNGSQWRRLDFGSWMRHCRTVYWAHCYIWH